MQDVIEMLEPMRKTFFDEALSHVQEGWELSLHSALKAPKALLRYSLHVLLTESLLISSVYRAHIDDVTKLLTLERDAQIHLPSGWVATRKKEHILFSKEEKVRQKSYFCEDFVCDGNFHEIKATGERLSISGIDGIVQVCSYEEGSKIYYNETQRKQVRKLIKEKSELQLDEVWMIKRGKEILALPQLSFVSFPYRDRLQILR
jgi:hypothetical protein